MSTYSKYLHDFYDDDRSSGAATGKLGLDGDADDIDLICFEAAKLRRKRELSDLSRASDQTRDATPAVTSFSSGYIGQQKRRTTPADNAVPAERPASRRDEACDDGLSDDIPSDSIWSIHIDGIDPVERPAQRREVRPQTSRPTSNRPSGMSLRDSFCSLTAPAARQASRGGSVGSRSTISAASASRMSGGTTNRRPSSNSDSSGGKGKGKRSGARLPKVIKRIALVLALLLICWYALIGFLVKDINIERVNTVWNDDAPAQVSEIAVRSEPYVTNVLLLGIDDDGSSGSRSDTIMIASVNSRTNTIKLCSILRDCYVAIPGYSAAKINSAYAHGGAELAMRTVQNSFRVRINKYASIDRSSMIAVVEAAGGVDIEITSAEAEQINKHSLSESPNVSAGMMHLDGRQAVAYAQIRKIDSDFNRTSRQRTLLNAIIAKCKTLSPGKLMDVVEVVSSRITTNMGAGKISSTGLKVISAIGNDFEQMAIPADNTFTYTTINGESMVSIDLSANVKLLHEFLFGNVE